MGVRLPSVATNTVVAQLPASAAETIIATLPPINLPLAFAQILLFWMASIQPGTAANILVFQLRRGTALTGQTLTSQTMGFTTVAGNFTVVSGCYFDSPGDVAGQQYVLTCSQAAATGVGVVRDVCLMALVL